MIHASHFQDKKTRSNEKRRDKRISSCDYAAWEKYDVDTEINRIELQDEQRQTEMKRIQERQKELNKMNRIAHKATVDKRKFVYFFLNHDDYIKRTKNYLL